MKMNAPATADKFKRYRARRKAGLRCYSVEMGAAEAEALAALARRAGFIQPTETDPQEIKKGISHMLTLCVFEREQTNDTA
jgi:hypothetical protein